MAEEDRVSYNRMSTQVIALQHSANGELLRLLAAAEHKIWLNEEKNRMLEAQLSKLKIVYDEVEALVIPLQLARSEKIDALTAENNMLKEALNEETSGMALLMKQKAEEMQRTKFALEVSNAELVRDNAALKRTLNEEKKKNKE